MFSSPVEACLAYVLPSLAAVVGLHAANVTVQPPCRHHLHPGPVRYLFDIVHSGFLYCGSTLFFFLFFSFLFLLLRSLVASPTSVTDRLILHATNAVQPPCHHCSHPFPLEVFIVYILMEVTFSPPLQCHLLGCTAEEQLGVEPP